ncbi:MAG: flagellar hook-length control protein FliK [Deltaproteobacteria bacterium]|nr:flagellar hook-length control protein FliK [Deltaproteobacteria bacterium]
MEAISAIKIPEPAGPGTSEEAGTDLTPALFAQVLAQQAVKPGPGLKPAAPDTDGGERAAIRSWAEEGPLSDSTAGTFSLDSLLVLVVPARILPPVTSDVVQDQPFPAVAFNREANFTRAVGAAFESGQSADSQPPALNGLAAAPEPGLKTLGGEGHSAAILSVPGDPLNLPRSAESASIPGVAQGRSLPGMEPGFATATLEGRNFPPEIVMNNGATTTPSSGNGVGDPKTVTLSYPRGPEGYPGNDPRGPESGEVPREDLLLSRSNFARSVDQAAFAAEEMLGRSPTLAERSPLKTPPSPEAGYLESQKPLRSDPAGTLPPEVNPAREFSQVLPEVKPVLPAGPDQIVPLPAGAPLKGSPEKSLSSAATRLVLDQPPAPENFPLPAESPQGPKDQPATGPETRSDFSAGERKVGTGMEAGGSPAAVSRAQTTEFSPAVKTGPPEAAAPQKTALPPDTGERRPPVQPFAEKSGVIGTDGGTPAVVAGNAPAPVEWSSPNAPLPVEPGMVAGSAPEVPPAEAKLNITSADNQELIPEGAKEKNPLYRQLSQGLVWSIKRGEEKIQLTLDPPQLGTIFLELHRKGQTVEAQVWTDNSATKGLLDTQQGQLHKALEQEGFRLDRFEVAVHVDLKSFQEERWAQGRQPAWPEARGQQEEHPAETARSMVPEKKVGRFQNGNRFIDTWI